MGEIPPQVEEDQPRDFHFYSALELGLKIFYDYDNCIYLNLGNLGDPLLVHAAEVPLSTPSICATN